MRGAGVVEEEGEGEGSVEGVGEGAEGGGGGGEGEEEEGGDELGRLDGSAGGFFSFIGASKVWGRVRCLRVYRGCSPRRCDTSSRPSARPPGRRSGVHRAERSSAPGRCAGCPVVWP